MTGAGVTGAGVTGAGVTGAGVNGAGVTGAGVDGAGVTGAGVTGASVVGAGVIGASVIGAGVTGAGVTGAGVIGAGVIGSSVIGAGVTGLMLGFSVGTMVAAVGREVKESGTTLKTANVGDDVMGMFVTGAFVFAGSVVDCASVNVNTKTENTNVLISRWIIMYCVVMN